MLLILEDNTDRLCRFKAAVHRVDSLLEVHAWRNAHLMIREVASFLPQARLLSLDHDLEPEEGDSTDPGTGWDVAQFLARQRPCCPVIVHTSNSERAAWMVGEFQLYGWDFHRVPALGDDWIEQIWAPQVAKLLRRSSRA
jgi:hypothetical protein